MFKRLGTVVLVGITVFVVILLIMFGMSCFAILFPLAIVASAVWYCIKYVVTGKDDDEIFK